MVIWKQLLEEDENSYTKLVSRLVLPALRINNNNWDATEPELMIRFLECWKKLPPSSILDSIVDTIIVPKVSGVVYNILSPWKAVLDLPS